MPKRRRQEGTSLIPSNLHVPEDCRAVSDVLARVGDKWTVLVVSTLGEGRNGSTSCGGRSAAFRNGC